MINDIYLRRKNKVILGKGIDSLPPEYLSTLLENLKAFGYTLSPGLQEVAATLSFDEMGDFYQELAGILKKMLGAHRQFSPMYPNFPEQVMNASQMELRMNAMLHYLGDFLGRRIMPRFTAQHRESLKDQVVLKVIDCGTREDAEQIFTRLMGAKTALTPTDMEDVAWFVKEYKDQINPLIPELVPLRENAAALLALLMNHTGLAESFAAKYIRTATDVLRVAAALSGGDISLALPAKYKQMCRSDRRFLLSLLETAGNITEDMLRYPEPWKRLGERLHPFEYRKRFPGTARAFEVIRGDLPFTTFNSAVEMALEHKDLASAMSRLKTRPGEMARRLDKLLRIAADPQSVIAEFEGVADSVSGPVLLQVRTHFLHRNTPAHIRVFFPKGDLAKLKAIANKLPGLSPAICEKIVDICTLALKKKYSERKPLGRVFVGEGLKNYTVPFALRSASKALRTLSRGSRVALPPGDTLRFFIWWRDGRDRTDIDLSASALREDHSFVTTIAYYNLRDLGACHSGDITSAPNGASEFIDISINKFLGMGIRYVQMCINSFTLQPYCDLPECFAGLMMRQHPGSGEIYDPRTVQDKFDLTANTRIAVPLIIDLVKREAIWTDMALSSFPSLANNVLNNRSRLSILNESMTSLRKPVLHDLVRMNAEARGTIVFEKKQADTIFDVHEGITPSDIDIIISDLL